MPDTINFLLVEDDDNDAFLVRQGFRCTGDCHLSIVENGEQAIHYLQGKGIYSDREQYPLPQVILLDLKMPRINGFEFLEWLRSKGPTDLRMTPVVIMSSSDEPKDVKRAYELGANSYLVKPVGWVEFRKRMEALNIYWVEHVETPPVSP
jgi:CheY-like chemotaxis protein